ncbi:MAG: hypothetical protein EB127_07055 [Alphaproteobacteria bacterium]|nr:hypothetical protein [Alphaproteobacteria bacterium]
MKQREISQNFNATSVAKEFMDITNKFINYLDTIDRLLDKSKLEDIVKTLHIMQSHSEDFARFTDNLTDRIALAEERLLEPLLERQKILDKISQSVESKLIAHIAIARKINEVMNMKLKKQIANEVGYDAMGNIEGAIKHFDPKVCLTKL